MQNTVVKEAVPGAFSAAVKPAENAYLQQPYKPKDDSRRLTALIVDDNISSAQTLAWMMEIMGCDIEMAHDGHRAIRAARQNPPDIILLDIGLPDMTGYDVCRQLKEMPELANTVFIAQTGWEQKKFHDMSMDAGFRHHLTKPVEMRTLREIMTML